MKVFSVIVFIFTITRITAEKKFADDFKFGAAGAAYQIEGAWDEDGKGASIWDIFTHIPGKIANNQTGDATTDFYHKYKEDIVIVKELGLQTYRFSVSWPRIFPDGTPNQINQAGLDYYISLLTELRENNIEPLVTLYHWDMPVHIDELGGWLNPQIADYFGDYARVVFKYLGPYVKYWVTLNEPANHCSFGYATGMHPPEKQLTGEGVYLCAYNSLRAHARAYRIYEKEFKVEQGGKVTINTYSFMYYPKTNSTLDQEAVERAYEFNVGLYVNPVYYGNWPQIVIDRVANRSKLEGYSFSRLPVFTQEEIDYINGTSDYFALNVYSSELVAHVDAPIGKPSYLLDAGAEFSNDPSWNVSISVLTSDPPGMRYLLNYLNKKYNPGEFIITENGWVNDKGLEDDDRIDYLRGYMSNLLDAIVDDGINVTGYTVWSLLDSFEWNAGYTVNLGLVHVDFDSPNKTRTLKKSAEWYKKVVKTRTIVN